MPVRFVVVVKERGTPGLGVREVVEPLRIGGRVFGGLELRLGERVVVADPWSRQRSERLAGTRLPPAMMTGLRRSLAEPGVTGAVLLATALAAGSFTVARLLTDSTSVLLSEKAAVYLGSDLTMTTRDITALPPPFDAIGTIVARSQGHSGSQSVDLLGIDRSTFARAVHWRNDASDQSLNSLLDALAQTSSGALPAIVVGGTLPDTHLESLVRRPMEIDPRRLSPMVPRLPQWRDPGGRRQGPPRLLRVPDVVGDLVARPVARRVHPTVQPGHPGPDAA